MDARLRKDLYNACDPGEPLAPHDPRNVDVDNMGDDSELVRGSRWVELLLNQVRLSRGPVCILVTGLPGTGKSTELKRLAVRLEKELDLFPVMANAEESLDLTNEVDVPELLLAIVVAFERSVAELNQVDGLVALREGYLARLWDWITSTDVELKKGELAVSDIAKLSLELRTRPTLRARVRQLLTTHFTRFRSEVFAHVELLQQQLRGKFAGSIVIVDSLEKLRGLSGNWHEVLASAEKVFSSGAPHLRLPVHVIYTVPVTLISRRNTPVAFLPMLKLRNMDDSLFAPGHEAAWKIVTHRISAEYLEQLLGATYQSRVDKLISWSGGYPRDIVRMLQSLLLSTSLPVSDKTFERVLNELGESYRRVVPFDAFPWLRRVATTKYVTVEDDAHRPTADMMLSNNIILRYLNDVEWYDLHPAVKAIPGLLE